MINKELVFCLGRSLGGAVALYTASKYPHLFRGVIIENSFTSMSAMVDYLFPYLNYLKIFILRNHWNSFSLVSQLRMPLLYVSGDKDELVPKFMTD